MSYSCEQRNTMLRKVILYDHFIRYFPLFIVFFVCNVSGQTDSNSIDALLKVRTARISQSLETRSVDLQLFQLGYHPKAIVRIQPAQNGVTRVTFPAFLPIQAEKVSRIAERLTTTYPFLISLHIATDIQEITLQIPAENAAAHIDELVTHFGYAGHE